MPIKVIVRNCINRVRQASNSQQSQMLLACEQYRRDKPFLEQTSLYKYRMNYLRLCANHTSAVTHCFKGEQLDGLGWTWMTWRVHKHSDMECAHNLFTRLDQIMSLKAATHMLVAHRIHGIGDAHIVESRVVTSSTVLHLP